MPPRKTEGFDWSAADAMTDEERHATALSDPDAQPLTDEQLRQMRRPALVKRIRRKLRLTIEEFAESYHLPIETVLEWERQKTDLDPVDLALLKAIAANPEEVAKAQKTEGA